MKLDELLSDINRGFDESVVIDVTGKPLTSWTDEDPKYYAEVVDIFRDENDFAVIQINTNYSESTNEYYDGLYCATFENPETSNVLSVSFVAESYQRAGGNIEALADLLEYDEGYRLINIEEA